MSIIKAEYRNYKCKECGSIKLIQTNHYGECYSFGNYNTCTNCPPYKRPNTWVFDGEIPVNGFVPVPWETKKININKN